MTSVLISIGSFNHDHFDSLRADRLHRCLPTCKVIEHDMLTVMRGAWQGEQ